MQLHDLAPALAATVVPALLILAIAYPLRPQAGRHADGLLVRVAKGWTPYDLRVRRAFAHYADKIREPLKGASQC